MTIIVVVNENAPILSAVSALIVLLVSLARALPVSMLTSAMIHIATLMPLVPTLMAHSTVGRYEYAHGEENNGFSGACQDKNGKDRKGI